MRKKIVVCGGGTGGHVFPAVTFTEFFKEKDYETILITDERGKKFLKKGFVNYRIINVSQATKSDIVSKIIFYIKLLPSFINSLFLLKEEKPQVIFGLGGYVSFPICMAAKFLNIKILLYEPNIVLGRVNKFFVNYCDKLFTNSKNIINLPEKNFHKCVKVGNILRGEILKYQSPEKNYLKKSRTIIILGGSQSAEIFGETIPDVIVELSKNFKIEVIQQTLPKQLNKIRDCYNNNKIENYVFNFHENILDLMVKADLAISRCGASTMGELEFLGIPFVAIPYPFAKDDHQHHNALYYEKKGCCWILSQKNLNFSNLEKLLHNILNNKVELSTKRENMFKNDSKNSLLKIEREIKNII